MNKKETRKSIGGWRFFGYEYNRGDCDGAHAVSFKLYLFGIGINLDSGHYEKGILKQ